MGGEECVHFLQSVLPVLRMRWAGFRKVHSQVCKRIQRRIHQLALTGLTDYRHYLDGHADEWGYLDTLCRISISRFYRDKQMYLFLSKVILPELARRAQVRGDHCLKIWSAGAASGEEPYTLAIIWQLLLQKRFPNQQLMIIATEVDSHMIERSKAACYDYSSVKNLPEQWRRTVFDERDAHYCLKQEYREAVQFRRHDLRQEVASLFSGELFDLILCRNLAFTYFDEPLQRQTFVGLTQVLNTNGVLIIGIHEQLPPGAVGVRPWSERLRVFEKTEIQQRINS